MLVSGTVLKKGSYCFISFLMSHLGGGTILLLVEFVRIKPYEIRIKVCKLSNVIIFKRGNILWLAFVSL